MKYLENQNFTKFALDKLQYVMRWKLQLIHFEKYLQNHKFLKS